MEQQKIILVRRLTFERVERVQHSGFRELSKTGLDWTGLNDDTFKVFPRKSRNSLPLQRKIEPDSIHMISRRIGR